MGFSYGSSNVAAASIVANSLNDSAVPLGPPVNLGLSTSLAANALTISIASASGAFSASNIGIIPMRSATATTGTPVIRRLTSAVTDLVISSGSTLGHVSGASEFIYVWAVDSGSGIVLGASTTLFDEGVVQSTTAEGAAGAADSRTVIYTTAAQSSKPIRLIGRLVSTQATAGTWATAISTITVGQIAGRGTGTFTDNLFNGDASDVTFDLSTTPANEKDIFVMVDGVLQASDTYSVSGVTLTFSEAPPVGTNNIFVKVFNLV